jgi:hypothetical protein
MLYGYHTFHVIVAWTARQAENQKAFQEDKFMLGNEHLGLRVVGDFVFIVAPDMGHCTYGSCADIAGRRLVEAGGSDAGQGLVGNDCVRRTDVAVGVGGSAQFEDRPTQVVVGSSLLKLSSR